MCGCSVKFPLHANHQCSHQRAQQRSYSGSGREKNTVFMHHRPLGPSTDAEHFSLRASGLRRDPHCAVLLTERGWNLAGTTGTTPQTNTMRTCGPIIMAIEEHPKTFRSSGLKAAQVARPDTHDHTVSIAPVPSTPGSNDLGRTMNGASCLERTQQLLPAAIHWYHRPPRA